MRRHLRLLERDRHDTALHTPRRPRYGLEFDALVSVEVLEVVEVLGGCHQQHFVAQLERRALIEVVYEDAPML
jgi:hypothetical protein